MSDVNLKINSIYLILGGEYFICEILVMPPQTFMLQSPIGKDMQYLKALELSLNPDINVLYNTLCLEDEFLKAKNKQELLNTHYFTAEFILKLYLEELSVTIHNAMRDGFDISLDGIEDLDDFDLLKQLALKITRGGYNPAVCSVTEIRQLFLEELGENLAMRTKALFVILNLFRMTLLPLYKKYKILPKTKSNFILEEGIVVQYAITGNNNLYNLAMSMLSE